MKKLLCILMVCMLGLSACGGGSSETEAAGKTDAATTAAGKEEAAGDAFVFTVKGVKVVMNAEAKAVTDALGEPKSYHEEESCAFKGLDKEYNYGSYIIRTYPKDDVDYISAVDLMDDTVQTAEGISIGATKDDVVKAYGEPTDGFYEYVKGDCTLLFLFDGDAVSSIQYTADTGL